MNKQELASRIWESANQMRSKIEAYEYKDYILGFIFYKYLCEKEEQLAYEDGCSKEEIRSLSEGDQEMVGFFQNKLGYFISGENLFSTWIELGNKFDISNVRDALSAFNRLISPNHQKLFSGILDTLETGLSKLGENAQTQTRMASKLIYLINDIPIDTKQDYDVLGFIYEYLISMFAATAGKKAGEFYTPHEVSILISEIVAHHLKDQKEIEVYDPTSGSGSLLINIGNSVARYNGVKNSVKYYAQEKIQNTYNLTRMNLIMRGILPDNILTRNADTLQEDWPFFDDSDPIGTYQPLRVDAVVSNPPYSQKWDRSNKEQDLRYRFGLAPNNKADYAFLLHDLHHVKPNGIMAIVLPHGVLFRGGEEETIRTNLINHNHIDTIIGLPANIFYGTGISTIIMVLKNEKSNTDILMIDASRDFVKSGKKNKLRSRDIKKIFDTILQRKNIDKYARVVSLDEVRENDYNLNISRYIDNSTKEEIYDIYATMFGGIPKHEIDELHFYWGNFPSLKQTLFENVVREYTSLQVEDIDYSINNNQDVQTFVQTFKNAFNGFDDFLRSRLVEKCETLNIHREINTLGGDIFQRLQNIPLIDKYEAYEILSNQWDIIAIDIEIIQTEGFQAVKQVDPNMVKKKKDNKEIEVQDGWIGHIIPFELAQSVYLTDEIESLKKKEDRLLQIEMEYEEILESLDEDEREADTVNEEQDGFIKAEVSKEAKQIKKDIKNGICYDENSYEAKILKVDELIAEERNLNKKIKIERKELERKTKEVIENLSDDEARKLLELKWIKPLETNLHNLPYQMLDTFSTKIQKLSMKYTLTLNEIGKEIQNTSQELCSLMNELEASEWDKKGIVALQQLLEIEDD